MSVRVHCRSCRTAFVTRDDPSLRPVVCPKCGAKQPRPAAPTPAAAASVFVPSEGETGRKPRRLRRAALGVFGLLVLTGVGVAVAWPYLRRKPLPAKPADPVAATATAFLKALVLKDTEAAGRLSTVDLPPAIRRFNGVAHVRARDGRLKGSFGPIAAFHARVNERFTYDESAGRFVPKNPLGEAAETLDTLHEAKAKAEKDGIYKKMQSGDPEDIFDAAEGLGKAMASLAEGALSPKKLIPTYPMLVEEARPPLPPAEKALALDYGARRETWDALLNRPFMTLKADGPYLLERAEVSASVTDSLASEGDPPSPLTLTLTRFRFEGIDTGWKVTEARRGGPSAEPPLGPAAEPPAPRTKSPGEREPDGPGRSAPRTPDEPGRDEARPGSP